MENEAGTQATRTVATPPAASPAQPVAATTPENQPAVEQDGGAKGQPSQEQQIARIVSEALAPITDRLGLITSQNATAPKHRVLHRVWP